MFLQYTQRWSKETYKIYLSCNSNNLPGYFNLIITFSVVYSPRKRDHCYWVPNKGNSHLSLVYTSKYLDKEKEHVKLSSWHEQVFIVKFARANGAFNKQRLVDFPLEGDAHVWITIATILRQGLFLSCPNNPHFQRERKSSFLKYETMSAYHFYGNLDERFPTNDTKNFGRFGKNGEKR